MRINPELIQMEKNYSIHLSLVLIISLFLHMVISMALMLPAMDDMRKQERLFRDRTVGGRDIIVNVNQDGKRDITPKTLLSDQDSSAKGFITRKKGDRWLNNSRDFKLKKGDGSGERAPMAVKGGSAKEKILLNDESEVVALLRKFMPEKGSTGQKNFWDQIAIPDKNDVTLENAIYYSNSGMFSYNTAKFKNFAYFKAMKDKIAAHWYPPLMANAAFGGYAPGRMRIMAIPSQKVKGYFVMDRSGQVVHVEILDSYGNKALDDACIDAFKVSKNFGPVPSDMKGKFIVIPFIFGYYSN